MLTPADLPGLDPSCLRSSGEAMVWEPNGSWRARVEPLGVGTATRWFVSAGPLWLDPPPSKVVYTPAEAARWVLRRWERDHGEVRVPEEWERTI